MTTESSERWQSWGQALQVGGIADQARPGRGHSSSKGGRHPFKSKEFVVQKRVELRNKVWIQASSKGQAEGVLNFIWCQQRLLGKVSPTGLGDRAIADVSHRVLVTEHSRCPGSSTCLLARQVASSVLGGRVEVCAGVMGEAPGLAAIRTKLLGELCWKVS